MLCQQACNFYKRWRVSMTVCTNSADFSRFCVGNFEICWTADFESIGHVVSKQWPDKMK